MRAAVGWLLAKSPWWLWAPAALFMRSSDYTCRFRRRYRYEYVKRSGRFVALPRLIWRWLPRERRRIVARRQA